MPHLLVIILHDLNRMPDLLAAWRRIGVPGATILRSMGGYSVETWLNKIGLGGISKILTQGETQQRTLLSVIADDDLLAQAISEADEVVGGFDRPHSGILFSIPIAQMLGVQKRHRPAPDAVRGSMQSQNDGLALLQRSTCVANVLPMMGLDPIIVSATASLETIVSEMIAQPRVRVVCVVNDKKRLIGLIDLGMLADAIFFTIFPEQFLNELVDLESALEYAERTHVQLAEDLMHHPVWLKEDDTLERAYHLMHENELSGLPVVDEHYHVISYISLLELMGGSLRNLLGRKEPGE